MQPYRRSVPKQYFLPIYWECQQSSGENRLSYNTESNPNAVVAGVPRPFSIDYLLGEKHQKPLRVPSGVATTSVSCVSHADLFTKDGGSRGPFDSEFFASFRRENFGTQRMAFSGYIQPDVNYLAQSEETGWSPRQKPKRMRTVFAVGQLERLEQEFSRQQYMVGGQRFYLSKELGLTETQVKVWFQNRRIRWRKEIIEHRRSDVS